MSLLRPWQVWALFALCAALVFAALGWTSAAVLRLDRNEQLAQYQAEREENIRLALWRADSALAPLIAQESAHPYFAFNSVYSAELPFNNAQSSSKAAAAALVPSPLLTKPSPYVLLHFQIDPAGRYSSPQVPTERTRDLLSALYDSTQTEQAAAARLNWVCSTFTREELTAAAPEPPPAPDAAFPQASQQQTLQTKSQLLAAEHATQQAQLDSPLNSQQQALQQSELLNNEEGVGYVEQAQMAVQRKSKPSQAEKNAAEFQKRVQSVDNQIWQSGGNFSNPANAYASNAPAASSYSYNRDGLTERGVREGLFRAVWIRGELLLVRKVVLRGQTHVQGCVLNWPALQAWLKSEVTDLLPAAVFEPARDAAPQPAPAALRSSTADLPLTARLAALPVALRPGPLEPPLSGGWTPMKLSLLIAWLCVLLGAAAVALLLRGTLALSERRAAFVGAVTHELRTPLTTFRLYTDLLASDRPIEPAKRTRYIETLRTEAARLCHLVENVLAYARLERGARGRQQQRIELATLIEQTVPRLRERAGQAGLEWLERVPESVHSTAVLTDPGAVEQILFNLVDNACKYASSAPQPRIELGAERTPSGPALTVTDNGPGLCDAARRTLFQPFSKSDTQAAHSAPGVGLGLALSRRLAQDMGGDLRLDPAHRGGARFVLLLRAAPPENSPAAAPAPAPRSTPPLPERGEAV